MGTGWFFKPERAEDSANLPEPDVIATAIVGDLEAVPKIRGNRTDLGSNETQS
jgi:hypothetical protein